MADSVRARPSEQALAVPATPAGAVDGPSGFDPSRLPDFNEVWDSRPAKPHWDREVEVCVVGKRCVYVNDHRIAGGKPYVSEGLPRHTLKSALGDVLQAFSASDIREALNEWERERQYFAAFHAAKAIATEARRAATTGAVHEGAAPQGDRPNTGTNPTPQSDERIGE